jgi:NADH:ubiquinone oxidoreductase subunit 2 (subunit N)
VVASGAGYPEFVGFDAKYMVVDVRQEEQLEWLITSMRSFECHYLWLRLRQ